MRRARTGPTKSEFVAAGIAIDNAIKWLTENNIAIDPWNVRRAIANQSAIVAKTARESL